MTKIGEIRVLSYLHLPWNAPINICLFQSLQVNNAPCTVVREGREIRVKFRDVTAGDFLKIYEDENIPCDLVLLASCNFDGHCYVTTGEILKVHVI